MSTTSNIEWTDTTWNPVVGCKMVSPGCAHCYAETMSNRLCGMARADMKADRKPGRKSHYLKVINSDGRWNGKIDLVSEALADPFKWRTPRRVFVNSMSDLFHEDIPVEYIWQTFAVMASCPKHTFQVLTKRTARMAEITSINNGASFAIGVLKQAHNIPGQGGISGGWSNPIPNVWLGTSVENVKSKYRIDELRKCKAAIRFLSCEPLLEDLGTLDLTGIHWVIVGGESGHGARQCDIAWIRSIVKQCDEAGVPCFVKQIGSQPRAQGFDFPSKDSKGGNPDEWPEDLRIRQSPALSEARP